MTKLIDKNWLDTHDWMLRSSNNGISYNGYKWKRKFVWNKCADWDNIPHCGNGFHGNSPIAYGYGFDYSRLELHETKGERITIEGDKIKVQFSRAVAYNSEIPEEAFLRCGIDIAHDGDTITPKSGELWIIKGTVNIINQAGGTCKAYGNAVINSKNQAGGTCWAFNNAVINSQNQTGGFYLAFDKSVINSQNQDGGSCWAYGNAVINSINQSGGCCSANDNSVINSQNQSGGEYRAHGKSLINAKNQAGGICDAYGNAVINSKNQSDGYCRVYDSSIINSENKTGEYSLREIRH